MSQKVNIDKLALEVVKKLDAYKDLSVDKMEAAVKDAARQTVNDMRMEIHAAGINGTHYANSWTASRESALQGRWRYSMVVHAKKPYYRLTHLLEKGHARPYGKRPDVKAYPHIVHAEKFAEEALVREIKRQMGGG